MVSVAQISIGQSLGADFDLSRASVSSNGPGRTEAVDQWNAGKPTGAPPGAGG
jgi:hypothetical protein